MEDENTQLKKHKAMLKNALQTSIRENEQLLEINQDLEKKLKLQNEHIDALTLLNQQLQKRCENLQEDNKAKANNSWT